MNIHVRISFPQRSGVSLIEVTFAIGVVLIGLVGLTSILPLAGRRAQDSLDFDTAAAISDAVANEVLARDVINDASLSGTSLQLGTPSNPVVRPFCLDPYLINNASVASSLRYDLSVFPFYDSAHDPLLDPSTSYTNTPGFVGQPRMQRVGLSAWTTLTANQQFEVARTWVESSDDLSQLRPKDRSFPAILTGLKATSSSTFVSGKRVPTGAYSWMVTVDPDSQSRHASMAVVVFQRRERVSEFPTTVAATPDENELAERIALVESPVGFAGGAGGTVRLLSSGNTLPNLTSGDWLMLSRTISPDAATANEVIASQVHRWYRVIGTDREATIYTPTDNSTVDGITVPTADSSVDRASDTTVWSRTVILDGSDWDFTPTATGNWRTYATLVEDVVMVNEMTISLAGF
ncbi:type IV pilus modification PilV family protein [Aporhodopirellula aestuarii]|uniref:Uncharacterized protein n=1 Tax=Aporhodopirellula aestuarii TaxID=2950107 RepID=A0ABT0U5Z1_9BACT|nr:hypothetical protein [Aporhodopirellula aestuarii]MCM2371756.1 hypothetical protein [Aporhodopirellula aestuarii]